jgi:hypothetical protein
MGNGAKLDCRCDRQVKLWASTVNCWRLPKPAMTLTVTAMLSESAANAIAQRFSVRRPPDYLDGEGGRPVKKHEASEGNPTVVHRYRPVTIGMSEYASAAAPMTWMLKSNPASRCRKDRG